MKNIYKERHRPAEKVVSTPPPHLYLMWPMEGIFKEIEQAINECLREPVTGNKRAVLADLIIIQYYLFGEPTQAQEAPQPHPMQSYSAPPMEQVETYIETSVDSEFLKAVDGRKADKVWKLIDELVEAVKILHPRMYTTFIDKVQDL